MLLRKQMLTAPDSQTYFGGFDSVTAPHFVVVRNAVVSYEESTEVKEK